MVSADLSKIGLPSVVESLILLSVPTLHPSKLKEIAFAVISIFILGLVILVSFSIIPKDRADIFYFVAADASSF